MMPYFWQFAINPKLKVQQLQKRFKDLNETSERFSGQLWPQNWAREEEEVMDFTKTSDRRYQLYNHSYDDALKNIAAAAAAAAIGWWVLPMGFVIKILRLRWFQLSFDTDQLGTDCFA